MGQVTAPGYFAARQSAVGTCVAYNTNREPPPPTDTSSNSAAHHGADLAAGEHPRRGGGCGFYLAWHAQSLKLDAAPGMFELRL